MKIFLNKTIMMILAAVVALGLQACKKDAQAAEKDAVSKTNEAIEETQVKSAADKSEDVEVVKSTEIDPNSKEGQILARLNKVRPDLEFTDIEPSPAPGIYQGVVNGEGIIYVTETADFFFPGDMIQVTDSGLVNVSDDKRREIQSRFNGTRKDLMTEVSRDEMIIFSPKGEVKASIAVFTDVDCGYCQKLHNEVPQLNEMGIEVKYLAYPRAGVGSPSYKKVVSAWCAKDKQDSLTKLKRRESIPENLCADNPVAKQFNLGRRAGVTGTPALVLESGELVPGYMPAPQLAKRIGL